MPEVIALAGTLAHAGEHRNAAVHRTNVADQFLDDDRLAHAGAAVCANLAAFGERRDEVEHFDARLENFHGRVLVVESGRIAVDGPVLACLDCAQSVQGSSGDVEKPAQGFWPDGNQDLVSGVDYLVAASQTVG